MSIGERVLLALSRKPGSQDFPKDDLTVDNALDQLFEKYPDFRVLVSGKRVADFGCGLGYQSIALVKNCNCSVVGIDSNKKTLKKAAANARVHQISSEVLSFVEHISLDMLNSFDVVISKDSFEHFLDPGCVLNEMSRLLNDCGKIFVTFGPPWLAPYGSHMNFFCKVPWINVLFSEETVMKTRRHFRSDGANKYEEVESGLNKMTVAKFESIVSSSKLKVTYMDYEYIFRFGWISKIPFLREFFIKHITVIFSNAT